MRSVAPMRAAKAGYIVMSVLFCAAGAIKLVGYFSKDLFRLAFQYDLAFGALLIALGAVTLAHLDEAMGFFSILTGVPVLSDGLFKVQIAVDARRFGIRQWWLVLALAMALGAALFMDGVLNLGVVLCTVKIIRHQQPDVVDVEYRKIGKDE